LAKADAPPDWATLEAWGSQQASPAAAPAAVDDCSSDGCSCSCGSTGASDAGLLSTGLENLHATPPALRDAALAVREAGTPRGGESGHTADSGPTRGAPVANGLSPAVTAWQINQTGQTGHSPDPTVNARVSQVLADVQHVYYDDTDAYVLATGIPSYDVGPFPRNPNLPAEQDFTFRIPLSPQQGSGDVATPLGPIGVLVNGVVIFNARDAMSYQNRNVWHQNAVVVEAPSFDSALGHPEMRGTYHHHQQPVSLLQQLGDDGSHHSPVIGFAFDGFPIYGPYGYANPDGTGDIVRMESSYQPRAITTRTTLPDGTTLPPPQWGPPVSAQYPLGYYVEDYAYVPGSGTLDEFNGRFTVTPEYPAGTYAYFTTVDGQGQSAYPYLIGPNYYGEVARDNLTHSVQIPDDVTEYTP
jgi:hypothetical protein